ncbi:Metallo-beta-lactamase L1 precursor [Candidatus Magnetomorum sp. HK-1]|nr:Metallo-beta-lactamase L1 precursor [Candidatus Magnetomorum sp. HK-1]
MKITNEIFQVGGSEFTSDEDAAIYAIYFDGHAAIIDSGCGGNQECLFQNIKDCGILLNEIEYLLLTHCHYDHTGGAASFKKVTNCKIVAHELDAQFLEKGDISGS